MRNGMKHWANAWKDASVLLQSQQRAEFTWKKLTY